VARRVIDTVILIRHWWDCWKKASHPRTSADAENWGRALIKIRNSDLIVSPVYIEFVAGVTKGEQLPLARSFLAMFKVLDDWNILPKDLLEACRRAERIPKTGDKRQLGDCLISSIAKRFRCEVDTLDKRIPRGF